MARKLIKKRKRTVTTVKLTYLSDDDELVMQALRMFLAGLDSEKRMEGVYIYTIGHTDNLK